LKTKHGREERFCLGDLASEGETLERFVCNGVVIGGRHGGLLDGEVIGGVVKTFTRKKRARPRDSLGTEPGVWAGVVLDAWRVLERLGDLVKPRNILKLHSKVENLETWRLLFRASCWPY
jgi:hypothetical protein